MNKLAFIVSAALLLCFAWFFSSYSDYSDLKVNDIVDLKDGYSKNIQPIFSAKCIACHSCFNSPCQLNLTSYEGTSRGANKVSIYDFPKVDAREPTRLYIDGQSEKEWRKKSFYPITSAREESSILSYLISQPPGIESGLQKKYISEESRVCISSLEKGDLQKYSQKNPAGRMPLGLPKLDDHEITSILEWQKKGAKGPSTFKIEDSILKHSAFAKKVSRWEEFFNQDSLQAQISSRYIYEHLFLASIFFKETPNVFFRLVRSKSKSGKIVEISSSYPFDDPGGKFYYRLRPRTNEIVHKSHIPFMFSDEKKSQWSHSFYKNKWSNLPKKMPPYGSAGANPFITFASIPAKSRYQFFLDEAGYHVMTFIKGPVCRGQTALNVINDHFWVLFMDPNKDPLVGSRALHDSVAQAMSFPSSIKDDLSPGVSFRDNYWLALKSKFDHLSKSPTPLDKDWLWDGDKENSNAILTIYRHFDSSTVLRGARGRVPKTVWVLDYHVFESIYYNLSAGYNVFGPVLHQLNSRLYMEVSRIASEDLFLSFLPKDRRIPLRQQWNQKTPDEKDSLMKDVMDFLSSDVIEKMSEDYPYLGGKISSNVKFHNKSLKTNFLEDLFKTEYSESVVSRDYKLNKENSASTLIEKDKNLLKLTQIKAQAVQHLPDSILLRYKNEVYTLIHNKSHYNVGMLLFENERRNVASDTLDVIPGVASSYVNLFINLDDKTMPVFYKKLASSKKASEVWSVLSEFSVSRSNPNFWDNYRWFSERSKNKITNEQGWLDLNRYINM